ncbi:MAG TPA: glycosyltransferase family A protein [Symbiobacteriaceae bacterium]|nr:glycosyltransferase family A protein [Symbiobacteriaceae bacterium]
MEWLSGSPGSWFWLALALYGLYAAAGAVGRWVQTASGKASPLSFVVLTRNQEHQIEGFLRSMLSGLRASPRRCELVLVDLGSTDATPYILERLVRNERVGLIRLETQEPGEALTVAHFLSQGHVAVVVDMRGQARASSVLETLRAIW